MTFLAAVLPLQLSLAALGETGVGYDSTAVNPRTGRYVGAFLTNVAADAQAIHQGDRVRQLLRNRFEAQYAATGGRDILDSDIFNTTRYTLAWQPGYDTTLHTDAAYAIGSPTLFYSRAGRPDVQFSRRGLAYPRQMIADYSVRQDIVHQFGEDDSAQLDVVIAGRYPITPQPRGATIFTPYATARWGHLFNEDTAGSAAVRVEYYALELFRPAFATTAFLGLSHNFVEMAAFASLEGGASIVQRNVGNEGWDTQPYFRARATKQFFAQHLLFGASYTHAFGLVSPTLGTGALDVVTASAYWTPFDTRLIATLDGTFQSGQGYDPVAQVPMTSTLATVSTGARFMLNRNVRLYARYDFQWETNERQRDAMFPDFVRHVVLAGLQVAWGSDDMALATMVPLNETQALTHAFGFGAAPAGTPVRVGEPFANDADRRRRSRLPGDPPDDEAEREERERERWNRRNDPRLPGEEPLPGESETPEPGDPFRNDQEDAR